MDIRTAARPWHAEFPSPRNKSPGNISRVDRLQKFRSGEEAGVDFLLVDLRQRDHEVRQIPARLYLANHFRVG